MDDISFSVREGELFAFLGENGAGKSTTINMLCTILEKTKGDVTICGGTHGNVLLNGVLDNIDKSIGGLDDGMFIDTMKEVFTFNPYAFGMDFTQQKIVLYAIAITLACIIIMIFTYSKTYKRK